MEREYRYRGRTIGPAEIDFIGELIAAHLEASRSDLSRRLCEAWNWRQRNGALCAMVCRGLLLMLARAGAITLPAARNRPHNPLVERNRPEPVVPDNRPVTGALAEFTPVEIIQVRRNRAQRFGEAVPRPRGDWNRLPRPDPRSERAA